MEFIQKQNFYKQGEDGKSQCVAKNVKIRISIDENEIISVEQLINERTKEPYKTVCKLNLLNHHAYNNVLVVMKSYAEMRDYINHRNNGRVVVKGFGK